MTSLLQLSNWCSSSKVFEESWVCERKKGLLSRSEYSSFCSRVLSEVRVKHIDFDSFLISEKYSSNIFSILSFKQTIRDIEHDIVIPFYVHQSSWQLVWLKYRVFNQNLKSIICVEGIVGANVKSSTSVVSHSNVSENNRIECLAIDINAFRWTFISYILNQDIFKKEVS